MSDMKVFFPLVKDIAHMGVVLAQSSDTVETAARMMEEANLNDIIFIQGERHRVFTVDDLMYFRRAGRNFAMPLSELDANDLGYVNENENILNILPKFDETHCRYLGVRDESEQLVGVVSYSDVIASVDPSMMIERRRLIDIISKRRITHVSYDTTTEEVLTHLENADDAVLIGEGGNLLGILTTRDALRLILAQVDTKLPAGNFMTSPVWTINEKATIKETIDAMQTRRFKRAIVVDDLGKFVGVVTQRELIDLTYGRWADLVRLHAQELGELVSTLETEKRVLVKESLTDPLTGIGNRRRFNQELESEIGRYYRNEGIPFSILILDIDHFKRVNDTYGHLAGDQVLQQLCQTLVGMLRTTDHLARWGGEEFAIVLPTATVSGAAVLAERMREKVADNKHAEHQITISIGVAEYFKGESIDEFIARADAALYEAKQTGRNRVMLAGTTAQDTPVSSS